MLSQSARRIPRLQHAVKQQRRNAGGAPHYNEPSGYLFGEKVYTLLLRQSNNECWIRTDSKASSSRPVTSERRLGEHVVYRHVWRHGICRRGVVLQAGHKVRHHVYFSPSSQCWSWYLCLLAYKTGRWRKRSSEWRRAERKSNTSHLRLNLAGRYTVSHSGHQSNNNLVDPKLFFLALQLSAIYYGWLIQDKASMDLKRLRQYGLLVVMLHYPGSSRPNSLRWFAVGFVRFCVHQSLDLPRRMLRNELYS